MPLNIDFLQILLHMLNFVLLAGGLTFLLFNPVNHFLEQRKDYFAAQEKKNQEEAEKNKRLHEVYEQQIKEADAQIAERKKASEKEWSEISAQYIREAKEKAAQIIAAAEQEASDRKVHILESAQTEISELVVSAAQKLLSDTVTPQRDHALYDEFIRLVEGTVEGEREKYGKK